MVAEKATWPFPRPLFGFGIRRCQVIAWVNMLCCSEVHRLFALNPGFDNIALWICLRDPTTYERTKRCASVECHHIGNGDSLYMPVCIVHNVWRERVLSQSGLCDLEVDNCCSAKWFIDVYGCVSTQASAFWELHCLVSLVWIVAQSRIVLIGVLSKSSGWIRGLCFVRLV